MTSNTLLLAVVHRPDVDQVFHVTEHPLDVCQLLVAHHYLFRGELQFTGADQVFPIELFFLADLHPVDAQLACLALFDVLAEHRMAAQLASPLGVLVLPLLPQRSDPAFGFGDDIVTLQFVTLGLVRVPDEDEPTAGGAFGIQQHVLDLKTIVELLELPTLAECRMGIRIPTQPQLLADDVMVPSSPENPAVALGIEPGVLHIDGPAKVP